MRTIVVTVGTSLLTNKDDRPWAGNVSIGDTFQALEWMDKTEMERISAETHTLYMLNLKQDDTIELLHSDTESGWECAKLLKEFLKRKWDQKAVRMHKLPGINYDSDNVCSSLQLMAQQVERLITQDHDNQITFAVTGGFKAQAAVMATIGSYYGIDVCYIHEQYRSLIYIPPFKPSTEIIIPKTDIDLPRSDKAPSQKYAITTTEHHPVRVRNMLIKRLSELPWVDWFYAGEEAYKAPRNGVKSAPHPTSDGRKRFYIYIMDDPTHKMPLVIETLGVTEEHELAMMRALQHLLSDLN